MSLFLFHINNQLLTDLVGPKSGPKRQNCLLEYQEKTLNMSNTFKLILIIIVILDGGRRIYNYVTEEPSDPISIEEIENLMNKFEENSETLLDNSEN